MAKYNSKKTPNGRKKSQEKENDTKSLEKQEEVTEKTSMTDRLETEENNMADSLETEESNVTDRLAISNIDFDTVSLPFIFKVFESFIGDKIVNISLFESENCTQYAIAKFTKRMYAKKAYEMTEGLKLEGTNCIFDLSFVPSDFALDKLIDECTESGQFEKRLEILYKNTVDENMIDISDNETPAFEIPESFTVKEQSQATKQVKEKDEKKSKKHEKETAMFSVSEEEEAKDFEFDISDKRFQNLLDNDDFMIDASNSKSKKQKATSKILQEKRKRVDLE